MWYFLNIYFHMDVTYNQQRNTVTLHGLCVCVFLWLFSAFAFRSTFIGRILNSFGTQRHSFIFDFLFQSTTPHHSHSTTFYISSLNIFNISITIVDTVMQISMFFFNSLLSHYLSNGKLKRKKRSFFHRNVKWCLEHTAIKKTYSTFIRCIYHTE